MKQVSAKASMRSDIVDRVFRSDASGKENIRRLLIARDKGEEMITLSGVKLYSRKQNSPRKAG